MTGTERAILVLMALAVGVVPFILSRRRRRRAVCRWRKRALTNNEEFLKACEIPADPLRIEVALAARRAIAKLATVPPETIRANDTFARDLIQLPYWDSLDWLGFIFQVERECRHKIRRTIDVDDAIDPRKMPFSDLQVRHVVKAVALSATQVPIDRGSS